MRRTAWAVVTCALVSTAAIVQAERLPLRKFTIADGLPNDSIIRISCDSRGYLWFVMRESVARFDGKRFTSLDHPLITRARVRDIVEVPAGTYWIATNHGLVRFIPGGTPEFQRVAVAANVIALARGRHADLWATTYGGLFRISGNSITKVPSPDAVVDVVFESDRGLWMGTEKGLFHRSPDGAIVRYTARDGLPGDDIRTILGDARGDIWIGTTTGLCRFHDTPHAGVERFTSRDGIPNDHINSLVSARDGRLWVATYGGVARSEEPPRGHVAFRAFSTAQGFSDRFVLTLAEDQDGDIWGGTESSGAFEIAHSGFSSFTEDDGLTASRIEQVAEDRQGHMFVVSGNDVLHTFDGQRFVATQPRFPRAIQYFGWGWNQIVLQAHDGEWWLATGEGLCRFPAVPTAAGLTRVSPRVYTTADGLGDNNVFRIFEDSRWQIWVSVISKAHPITRFDRETRQLHTYGVRDGMPGDRAPSMFAEDRAGNVWIGMYYGGVLRFRNEKFSRIAGVPEGTVGDMKIDRAGRLWIATESGGVARIEDPTASIPAVRVYSRNEGLSTNQIYSIVEDRFGRIYLGTSRGINRLDPDTGRVKRFTTADGLPNNLISVAHADRDGALWFGTLQGIARFVPQPDEKPSPPPIWISGLRVAGVPHAVEALGAQRLGPITLEPHQNQIEIDFETVSFRAGEELRYQYRLAGDRDWSGPTEQRGVALASLAPGNYHFEVRAVSNDGVISDKPAVIDFAILPPVWRRWWFVVSVAISAIAVVHLYYRARARRLLDLERVRVRIASDLHDDIGASLSRIAVLSEVVKRQVDDPRSGGMLADVADSARSAVESMSDIVWSIDPRRDDVVSLNRRLRECAAEILDPAGILWTFQSDAQADRLKLGPAQRRHLYLVVKEALTNAVRHAGCHSVTIAINTAGHLLQIEIADDGDGFDPQDAGEGHGLQNMRRRLSELGGQVSIEACNGNGTHLKIAMPLGRTA
jgi:ligand-binding sensor domain-containing protein/signal transduction histidine kinase